MGRGNCPPHPGCSIPAQSRQFLGKTYASEIWRSCRVPTNPMEFHEEASAEYDAAFDWYLERSPDAASEFDAELDRALEDIVSAPQRWAKGQHSTRRYLLRASRPCWSIANGKITFKLSPWRTQAANRAIGGTNKTLGDTGQPITHGANAHRNF